MFSHNKRLQYTVRVSECNPGLANLMLEQFGGAQGELAVPWTAAYVDNIGEPTADLRSNIAAEARAKIVYERLINLTADPGVKEALGFLMTREIAHQKSFEKALYAIEPNFPPGKLPGRPEFTSVYFNLSKGGPEVAGAWNSGEQWEHVSDPQQMVAVDGGDGLATVELSAEEAITLEQLAARTMSDPDADPLTGAELGAGIEDEVDEEDILNPRSSQ